VISKALRDDFLDRFAQLNPAKVFVAHDGADPVPNEARGEGLVPGSGLSFGYVGQLYAGKGLEIIADLAERCPWADFHIVGGRNPELIE
jgi:hypothetical protein